VSTPTAITIGTTLLTHLASIVGFVMALVLVARSAQQHRPIGSTFAWVLAIMLIPYVGVPLYLMFGGRKLKQRSEQKRQLYAEPQRTPAERGSLVHLLWASGAPPPTSGNTVELLATGEAAYAAVAEALRGASRSIHISTLIFAGDEVGLGLSALLEQKAREGLEVCLLVDALFRFRAGRRQVARLRAAGARVAWFMPVWSLRFRTSANLRLHRKAVLVDGAVAIVGGMNLASEYMGPTPLEGRWVDLSARLRGPVVADVEALFAADWAFAAPGARLAPARAPEPAQPAGGAAIQAVGSGPDVETDPIYDAFLTSIFSATRRLWIATPYFVPDDALARAIVLAARRGVDVRIVVPSRSNHLTADLSGGTYLREIAHAGARVHCFEGTMMHAKLMLVDDDLGVLGSANMDMRSLFLDYEVAFLFTSRPEIDGLAAWLETLFPRCRALLPATRTRALLESVGRLVAPLE
jgi:cardiolipin synthase